ncbi:MAG TPA: NAD(P)-dependent oxidoreductase [Hanamia sp.]|nr:NAD(P)-dependent oxidoreductase [Hanamia sp.]
MRKILLTGAGGLVGTHLFRLLNEEHEVYTISRKNISNNNINIDFSKEWDTRAFPKNLDTIIHLAQSENFRDFPDKAIEVFNVNTTSTLKLTDFACKTGVKTFVFASSAGIYGNSDFEFDESMDIVYKREMGFYLATKQCSEIILDNYSTLLQVIQLRLFFVYGNGQRKDMLIPRLIDNVRRGVPLHLQGASGITINPTHVSDAAKAIKASLNLNGSHKINIAGPELLTMKEIGGIIGNLLHKQPQFILEEKEAKNLIGSTSNMSKKLIKPVIKFKDGIKDLI